MAKLISALALALVVMLGLADGQRAHAAAQTVDPCLQQSGGACIPVSPTNPLPVGGDTIEVCTPITVTVGTYGSGTLLQGLLSLTPFSTLPTQATVTYSGWISSISLNFKDSQANEFDVTLFRLTCSPKTPPEFGRVRPPVREDGDEEQTVHGRADNRDPEGTGIRHSDG